MKKYFIMVSTLLFGLVLLTGCTQKSEEMTMEKETETTTVEESIVGTDETKAITEDETVVKETESEEESYYIPEGVNLESNLCGEEWLESFVGVVNEPVAVIVNDVTGRKEVIQKDSVIYLDGKDDMVGIYSPDGEIGCGLPTDYCMSSELWELHYFENFEEGDYQVSECPIHASLAGEGWRLQIRVYTGAAPQNIIDDLTAPMPYRVFKTQ